jgi:isopenicillin-N epimerase
VHPFQEHQKISSWMLDPNITYLNHGSFGARARSVFAHQHALKQELEASPVNFLDRQMSRLQAARETIAFFLGTDEEGFGFVDNATTGVGCVLQSIAFTPNDEIVATSLVYNGVRQLLTRTAKDAGCTYREIPIELPVQRSETLLDAVTRELTASTKLLVIDHVSSSSAIVFPVEEIVRFCKEKGVLVLVDGAHAPGMLALDIDSIGADWYIGNLHKWVCAPLGAGFVWASNATRLSTHPMTVSHWYGQGFANEFDWQGTKDITSWLTAAEAVRWGDSIGWGEMQRHNHELAVWMQQALVEEWGVVPLSPIDGSMLGNMATVPLPDWCPNKLEACFEFRDELFEKYKIEVPIFELQGRGVVRVSAQLYTRQTHLERLISAVGDFS